ncbi:MAG TPA: DoxX family protein [Flavobacteriales bacterium]|nr:DoxX family protein [Flavobacteriales bacterium]
MTSETCSLCTPQVLLQIGFAAMVAILFLQSSLDKIFDWKGNKEYLTQHFAKSPLKGSVPMLLPVITLVEFSAGASSAVALVLILFGGPSCFGIAGMTLGMVALAMLFFGQRVAKDYGGAASLVPYFLMCAAGLYVFGVLGSC